MGERGGRKGESLCWACLAYQPAMPAQWGNRRLRETDERQKINILEAQQNKKEYKKRERGEGKMGKKKKGRKWKNGCQLASNLLHE